MYELLYSEKALKQLRKLEKHNQQRIISSIERIRIRPESHLKKLVGDMGWSLRVGDYRVIIDLDQGKLIITVIKVAHRKNVYLR